MQSHRTDPIRLAVVAGEFEKALCFFNEYVEQLAGELRQGPAPPSRLVEMQELVEWARRAALAACAHAQNRLNTIHVAQTYEPPDAHAEARIRAIL